MGALWGAGGAMGGLCMSCLWAFCVFVPAECVLLSGMRSNTAVESRRHTLFPVRSDTSMECRRHARCSRCG